MDVLTIFGTAPIAYLIFYFTSLHRPQRSVPSSVSFEELLDYFVVIQQKHSAARRKERDVTQDLKPKFSGEFQKNWLYWLPKT